MARILCLESSTEVCSVCIHENGTLLAVEESLDSFKHSKMMTVYIQRCLDQAELDLKSIDAVAITSGPGSYTGLRVGAATAKGICFGIDIPLITIPTLEALATGYLHEEPAALPSYIFSMLDARRNEVYGAIYDSKGGIVKDTFSYILDEHRFPEILKDAKRIHVIGNGVEKAEKALSSNKELSFHSTYCSSKNLIPSSLIKYQSADFTDLISFSPAYHKNPNITQSKKRLLS
jgi:tRNA threonylcarbamoyladenosine biosynthesis protein TsaB